MFKIFGYGTFITKKLYKSSFNVQPAYLSGYFRIYSPNHWFPFIVKDNGNYKKFKSGFWGLIFEVDQKELAYLDMYESEGQLYDRIIERVVLKSGQLVECYLYYPTQKIIEDNNLYELIQLGDGWRQKIINEFPEIISEFPELEKSDF